MLSLSGRTVNRENRCSNLCSTFHAGWISTCSSRYSHIIHAWSKQDEKRRDYFVQSMKQGIDILMPLLTYWVSYMPDALLLGLPLFLKSHVMLPSYIGPLVRYHSLPSWPPRNSTWRWCRQYIYIYLWSMIWDIFNMLIVQCSVLTSKLISILILRYPHLNLPLAHVSSQVRGKFRDCCVILVLFRFLNSPRWFTPHRFSKRWLSRQGLSNSDSNSFPLHGYRIHPQFTGRWVGDKLQREAFNMFMLYYWSDDSYDRWILWPMNRIIALPASLEPSWKLGGQGEPNIQQFQQFPCAT